MELDFASAPPPFLAAPGTPPISWKRWEPIFENFVVAKGGDDFSVKWKAAMLQTCLGTEGQRVYSCLPPMTKVEGEDDYTLMKRRLATFYVPKTNICAERYRFRTRGQQPGETVQMWVAELRHLASTCEYTDRTDEFIRDQVVERVISAKLRERLLMETDLTLSKLLVVSQTFEGAQREAKEMLSPGAGRFPAAREDGASGTGVNAINQRRQSSSTRNQHQGSRQGSPSVPQYASGGGGRGHPGQGQREHQGQPVKCFCCGGASFGKVSGLSSSW